MLSVLIPTYNCNITSLVKEIHKQCLESQVEFEILAYDDASKPELNVYNNHINGLEFCEFKILPSNLGRSAIRNLLAKDAKYNRLLFIDAGTYPKYHDFIARYLTNDLSVSSGGMTHLETPPKKPYKLRWLYTKKREYKTLCSSNFLIDKSIFLSNPFDENLKKYGYEDVLFFEILSKQNIPIHFFDNPVIHDAKDDADTFIEKTENALDNLASLIKSNKIDGRNQKIYRLYRRLQKLKLVYPTQKVFEILKPVLLKNFKSSYASILLFDIYKIGYFCQINHKE